MADVDAVLDEDSPQATPAAVADLDPSEPALIVFTSGTTGEPRGAVHAQRYLPAQRTQAEHWLGAVEGDLAWVTTATGWSKSARNVFLAPWLCGAAALIDDSRFDPERRLEVCEREGVSVLCQAPTEYRMLAKRTELRPLPEMRRLVSAGEPLNPEVLVAFSQELGTRDLRRLRTDRDRTPHRDAPGEATRARLDGQAAAGLRDADRRGACSRCASRAARPSSAATSATSRSPASGGRPATRCAQDHDGYLWFQGRDDDLILSAGYRIGPFEVESALLWHWSVAEAAAVPVPDEERGQVVKAVVVLRDGRALRRARGELQEYVKAETAPYKFPRIVEFAAELPKTASGKIKRAELR